MSRPVRKRGAGTFTRVRVVLACTLVGGVAAAGTLASWSDREFAGSPLTTGTFALVSRADDGPFVPHPADDAAVLSWSLAPLLPGQSTAAWVQVQSSGSVGGDVTLSGVDLAEEPVAGSPEAELRDVLTVRVSATASVEASVPACTTDTAGVEVTGLTTLPTLAAQPVEPAGASTVSYCIVVTLPNDAPSAVQGATLTPTWVFTGST